MHVHTDDVRTVEQVDAAISEVEAAQEKLRAEQKEITRKLNDSTDDDSFLSAALSGKSLTTSTKVGKLEARAEEITEMIRLLEARHVRLRRERVLAKQEALEQRKAALTEDFDDVQERFNAVKAELDEARDAIYFAQQDGYSLRDELHALENQLWQIDPAFRQEQEEAALRRREEVLAEQAEQAAGIRRRMVATSGLYIDLDDEQLENLQKEAERVGSRITVLGPKYRGDE